MNNEKNTAFNLSFAEIQKLNELVENHIKNDDYGFMPVMLIKIDRPDEEWQEKEYVSAICVHELTKKAINNDTSPLDWIDITDEDKFDFI